MFDAVIIVFDAGNRSSFSKVPDWRKRVKVDTLFLLRNEFEGRPEQVSSKEARKVAEKYSMGYVETQLEDFISVQESLLTAVS